MQSLFSTVLTSVLALAVGFWLGTLYPTAFSGITTTLQDVTFISEEEGVEQGTAATNVPADTTAPAGSENQEGTLPEAATDTAFTISVSSLPEIQQQALRAVGVDTPELVITSSVVACVEEKLGTERMLEIKNGSGVSVTEGITLVGCYQSN